MKQPSRGAVNISSVNIPVEAITSLSSKDLEVNVLGAILLSADQMNEAFDIIHEDVFYYPAHKKIFKAILGLIKTKQAVDILTVTQALIASGEIKEVGGAYYVASLTNKISTNANSATHCRILLQLYLKRKLIGIGQELITKGYDTYTDCFEIMDYAEKEMKQLESSIASDSIAKNEDTIKEVVSDIKQAKGSGGIIGFSTGIKSLDHGIMGLRTGLKYLIAARPGMGKTSLAKSICIHLAHEKKTPGVFFSMEMTRQQLMMACISEILSIPNHRLQKGDVTPSEIILIENITKTFFATNFLIDDRGGLDPRDIRSRIKKLVDTHGIKWLVIDYLGLMKLKGKENQGKSRENVISDLTSEIKNIAKEFNVVAIELAQLSREVEKEKDKRPKLHHLKDSGALEANADVVILIHRPEYYGFKTVAGNSSDGFAELIIAKNRFGPTMSLAARYTADLTQFKTHEQAIELEITQVDDELNF